MFLFIFQQVEQTNASNEEVTQDDDTDSNQDEVIVFCIQQLLV